MFHKGLLQWMGRTIAPKSFDRKNTRAVLHDSQRKARIEAHSVHNHSAGATLPMIAPLLGAREEKFLAQQVKKSGPREKFKLRKKAVPSGQL
jgi:hypothetical protein